MSSFIRSLIQPTHELPTTCQTLFYTQGIEQRAKDATLMKTWDTYKVVAHSKELKQEDVMEIDLFIRKDVSQGND